MMVFGTITECDITGTKYPRPIQGIHCLARGATGRWCCVMYIGPDSPTWVSHIPHVISVEEAAAKIESMGDWLDY
jgi:hypothetical protein